MSTRGQAGLALQQGAHLCLLKMKENTSFQKKGQNSQGNSLSNIFPENAHLECNMKLILAKRERILPKLY